MTLLDSNHGPRTLIRRALPSKQTSQAMRWLAHAVVTAWLLGLWGCTNIGPGTVSRDRFDYNAAISDSWKQQTLLNIVKARYADMPLFVEVASVVSGYTLERSVDLGGTVSSQSAVQGNFFSLGTSGTYIDRPTITYAPITGKQFNKSFMAPIPPRAILFLMQSGWPVDLVLPLAVDAINGFRSRIVAGASQRSGDTEFYRIITLLRKLQLAGVTGMQIRKGDNDRETTVLFFRQKVVSPDMEALSEELDKLLGLPPGKRQVTVSYGFIPANDTEITLLTRSMLQILIELATLVDVPEQHVREGRTVGSLPAAESGNKPLIAIHHSKEKPLDGETLVSIFYRGYWYWIDDRDFRSKRTFTFVMVLMSLTETGGREGLPLVTIPAG